MSAGEWRRPARGVALVILALLPLTLAGEASARDWPVEGKLFGELKKDRPIGSADAGDYARAEDISGIACARNAGFPRLCIVVDDQTQGAQILIVKKESGQAGGFIPFPSQIFRNAKGKEKVLDFDGEAVAYADGAFYVIGSHGRPRHEKAGQTADKAAEEDAKAEASRRLFRIVVGPGAVDLFGGWTGKALEACPSGASPLPSDQRKMGPLSFCPTRRLNEAIAAQPELAALSNAALQQQGLSIEGLAVRDGRLYAGLRTPVIDGRAFILSVAAGPLFGSGPLDSTLIPVALGTDSRGGPRGIRDLAPFRDGFLILAGPANDPPGDAVAMGDYALFQYADGQLTRRLNLKSYGARVKPEGLLPLTDDGGKVEVLLLFDGPDEGGGQTVTFDAPKKPDAPRKPDAAKKPDAPEKPKVTANPPSP
ncbi:DUF3616 domain-containing protein [Ancylobacter amanitiformis]|uniref:DUF3616 domain-containing protein n=1 Tax=Ancylobacter amanitiformis TaxID=217069 RepID=A0ABU0LLX9_9HYPH|nr:DUF3616 domain-containing protein [Ancylobacter amanitiformis]MDQ0509705.1 hypothetical protein [Ancylobacter amanitiformis]